MADARPSDLRFRDLGPIVVERDGADVGLRGRRMTAAVALLLVRANQRVTTDALVDAVWGDDGSDRGAANLQAHIWRLRTALEPGRRRGEPFTTVVHDEGGYRLAVRTEQADSRWFEQLVGEAHDLLVSGQADRVIVRTDQALALWRGDPWAPHSTEHWALPAVQRLRHLRDRVRELRVRALLELGEPERALADLGPLLAEDALREPLWALSMVADHRLGRTDRALATYRLARRILVEATGLEPGAELRGLRDAILAGGPVRDGPRRAVGTSTGPTPESSAQAEIHLPHRRSELIGRDRELQEVIAALAQEQVITIVGTAGCGKTRLAVEAARSAAADYPDGVWFVDLTVAGDADELLDLVTSAVGLAAPEVGTVAQALRAFARSRRMLLLLDNCEHIVDQVADLVDSLRGQDGELVVLATSRMPLDLDGEHVIDVGPIPGPTPDPADVEEVPAVRLFLQRLTAAMPRLSIGPQEIALAADICRAVDSLPLAIELAAGQARSSSLDEILDRVRTDPVGLSRIGRGGSHHATLRGAIESSVALLRPDELTVHQAVAVVPGPFTTDLAAELSDLPRRATADAIGNLVYCSMLTPLGTPGQHRQSRFSQLATIRSQARRGSRPEEQTRLQRRRDHWVSELAGAVPFVGDAAEHGWLERIDDDLAAVRATLQHCLVDSPDPRGSFVANRLGYYWFYQGMTVEWIRWTGLAARSEAAEPQEHLLAGGCHAVAASLSARGDLCATWLDELDEYGGSLSPEHELMLGQLLLSLTMAALVTNAPHAGRRAAAHLDRIVNRVEDPRLLLLSGVAQLLADVTDGDPGAVLTGAENVYEEADRARNHTARWMLGFVGSLAALRSREVAVGLRWSDLLLREVLQLTTVNVPGLELRGALLMMAGRPYEAVADLAWSRARARRHGFTWPLLPSTPDLLTAAQDQLSPADAERAYREGLESTISEILARSGG